MASIRIDNGWEQPTPQVNLWIVEVQNNAGDFRYQFATNDSNPPEFGDLIFPGSQIKGNLYAATFQRGTFPIINNDPGVVQNPWRHNPEDWRKDTWPRDDWSAN